MKNVFLTLNLLCILLLFSCKESTTNQLSESSNNSYKRNNNLPSSTGGTREIIAVIDNSIFLEPIKSSLSTFERAIYAMPQQEPEMKLHTIPRSGLNSLYRVHRNLLFVENTSEKPELVFSQDLYSSIQNVVTIKVSNEKQLDSILYINRDKIIDIYKEGDFAMLQNKFKKTPLKNSPLNKKFGASLDVPNFYRVGRKENDFIWILKDVKKGQHTGMINLIAYKIPMENNLEPLSLRNKVTKKYVPGQLDGSYMIVDFKNIPPRSKDIEIDGKYAIRSEGLWRMENEVMGGPFVNYTIFDEKTGTIWGIDAFIFYPSQDKAQFMIELEAILKTFKTL